MASGVLFQYRIVEGWATVTFDCVLPHDIGGETASILNLSVPNCARFLVFLRDLLVTVQQPDHSSVNGHLGPADSLRGVLLHTLKAVPLHSLEAVLFHSLKRVLLHRL
jgi:hypothetical protein